MYFLHDYDVPRLYYAHDEVRMSDEVKGKRLYKDTLHYQTEKNAGLGFLLKQSPNWPIVSPF